MSQTSYAEQGFGLAGQKASLVEGEVLSYAAEGMVPVGRMVCVGTNPEKQIKLPAASADVTSLAKKRGVAIHTHTLETKRDGLVPNFSDKQSVPVMSKGEVVVEVEVDVAVADAVYVRYAGKKQVQTITFSVDLIASNVVNGKVGGLSISPVTYATSHAATMAAIAAAILAANSYIETATVLGDVLTLTTVLDAADQDVSDWVVTLGSSQPTVTLAETIAAVNSDKKGSFRNDADSSSAAALAGARWMKASEVVSGKKLAVLELAAV